MQTLFDGAAWEDLAVENVEAFLAEQEEEGLTWEGKGTTKPHRDSVRKGVCGFANSVGGYHIIGAERGDKGWTLPGVDFEGVEVSSWLSSLIAPTGVTPVPWYDTKVFSRPEGRHAAVIAVEPSPTPPCITASGIVFQRVSSITLPVTDPRVLAELIAKGDAARHNAEATALRAAQTMLAEPAIFEVDASQFAVALSPLAGPPDKSAVLFSRKFSDAFQALVQAQLQPDSMVRYDVMGRIGQDRLVMWPTSREFGNGTTAAVFWDGAAAVSYSLRGDELYVEEMFMRISRAWRALGAVLTEFGAKGEAHFAVLVNRDHPAVSSARRGTPSHPIQRWTEIREPDDDELASVERELKRGFGETAFEG